ncbi:UNVERIFIED_CONTAM: hypothetical protein H355_006321 [Colinus virginianus]|nr:hypothetical protein H355_006321 [Colinus virginianus]
MAAWRRGPGLCVLLCALHVQAACRGSVVSQELLKEGFHRELLLKAELDAAGRPEGGCAVAARARLPSGVYVDPYELASLQRHNVTKIVYMWTERPWVRFILSYLLCLSSTEHLSPECWRPAEVEVPCLGNKDHPCQWYSAKHQPDDEELILQVPVGRTQHSFLVCVVTLLATVLCSSLILAAVCKHGDFSLLTCLE